MPENWNILNLNEIAEVIDSLHKTPKYSTSGYPMVRAQEIIGGNLNFEGAALVSKEVFDDFSRNHSPKIGDLVFSRVGAHCGKTSYVNTNTEFCLGQNTVFIVPKGIDNKFLYYILSSPSINEQINRNAVVSSYKTISLKTLRELQICFPKEEEEQKSIASILSALDDKIELNLQMNKTLEEMAMTLYKHWFVDFGPFQDGEFVDSELGKIPKGWEVKTLEDEFKITIGRTPPRKEKEWFSSKSGIKWISIKDMGNCGTYIFNTSEYLTEEAVVKKNVPQIRANTVILSFKLTVGRVTITTENMVSNEAIAHFLKKKNTLISAEYLYSALKSFDYNSLGSTSSIATAVNSKTVKSMKILVPVNPVIDNFQQEIFSFFELIKSNSKEIQSLTQLRNTLLPKLISGEVRVKDVEKTLNEVL